MNVELLRKRQPALSIAQKISQHDLQDLDNTSGLAGNSDSECMNNQRAEPVQSYSKDRNDLPVIKEGFGYTLLSSMGITEETPLVAYEGKASNTDSTCSLPSIGK
ncbi:Hypothetical protein GLP15_1940 [Giardia lamblia P15]|uniref:Uncharacterized protein n=1 Tax=Giardia intestinalis (strain P15) TaxID=658858 RepID=E1F641_GIAIA|nr:Hypothetical protein GLP15_1940 [Giardia lamblia P15]